MKNIVKLVLTYLSLLGLAACSGTNKESVAPIEYKGDKYFGFDQYEPEFYSEGKQVTSLPEEPVKSKDLKTPRSQKTPQPEYYTIKSGDNLHLIAKKYNIKVADITAANNLNTNENIYPGQTLKITKDTQNLPKIKYINKHKQTSSKSESNSTASTLKWPLTGNVILKYGATSKGTRNDGINISADKGTPVKAASGGTVVYSGSELKGYGNLIIIKHKDNLLTAYAHLSDLIIDKGDQINKGDIIGHVGKTGYVNQPQLHFAVRKNNKPVNPESYLP